MIVAVTGGTGFIGRRLVSRLVERGDTVRILTRSSTTSNLPPSVETHKCDLMTVGARDLTAILDGVDVFYHCAGQLKDANVMWKLHVDATHKLVEAASRRVDHWVQLSSVGVYGPVALGAITEDSAINPVGLYEASKAEADKIVVEAANNGNFSYSILRPSNVFGAGMTNQSLFAMISMIARGWFFYIGKQGACANYIHVNNVVKGLICCGTMQAAKGNTYNLSDNCAMEHFVKVIANELGRPPPWLRLPEPIAYLAGKTLGRVPGFPLTQSRVNALVNRSFYPVSRIQRDLGYGYDISMEEGLCELVKEYSKGQNAQNQQGKAQ